MMRTALLLTLSLNALPGAEIFLAQGCMSGEASDHSALVQTRLTAVPELDESGRLPGRSGVVAFEWSTQADFSKARRSPFQAATGERDFIVRAELSDLAPGTTYHYRPIFGPSEDETSRGPSASFKTLAGKAGDSEASFIVGSCMNYNKFMYGKRGRASGPLTATDEDKQLGFPAFEAMTKLAPDFFIGTGDIVYYDNPLRVAETVAELRNCWHEQFRFPRMVRFFSKVPTYWSKDDHDFRYNDSDNTSERLPLSKTGIDLFHEQLPIAASHARQKSTYRTIRVNRNLQIWLTEGRDFRSPNDMKDGPGKTLWGDTQFNWLKETLKTSDAKWKILVTPTPIVGPDKAAKRDNHTNLNGFRHEASRFINWLEKEQISNFMTICGDRHWQYHSIHPSGLEEFACGALNDENAFSGVPPGDKKGTDPEGLIRQPYLVPERRGGFIRVTAGDDLKIEFFDAKGELHYLTTRK